MSLIPSQTDSTNYRTWGDSSAVIPTSNITAATQNLKELMRINPLPAKIIHDVKFTKVNEQYAWEVARIQALILSIFQLGVSDQDPATIQQIEQELKELKNGLQDISLSKNDKSTAEETIDKAYNMLIQARVLSESLVDYHALLFDVDKLQETFVENCYNPETGNPLNGAASLKSYVLGIAGLDESIYPLIKTPQSLAATKLFDLYQQEIHQMTWMLEDWDEAVQSHLQNELNALHSLCASKDPVVLQQAASQLNALSTHIEGMINEISTSQVKVREVYDNWSRQNPMDTLQIQAGLETATNRYDDLIGNLQRFHLAFDEEFEELNLHDFPRVDYDSSEWMQLFNSRPKSLLSRFWNKASTYLNPLGYIPERWRPKTTQIQSVFLTALAVGEQVHRYSNLPKQAESLRARASLLQKQSISKQQVHHIDKEVGLIGTLLSDKFEVLTNKETLNKLTRKFPETRTTLEEAVKSFGDQKPTSGQMQTIMDMHRAQRLMQESGQVSPFQSLSFNKWLRLFSEAERPPSEEAAKVESTALGIVKGLGKLSDVSTQLTSAIPEEREGLTKTLKKESYQKLREAMQKLPGMRGQLTSPALVELKQEAALLQQQLLDTVSETPSGQCSLPKLALWTQRVEDVCYAIQDIEKRIGFLMDKARHDLAASEPDVQLERYGKKHMNLVKQARLAESLEIPGVTIPVPQGFSTVQILAFIKNQAPSVFMHWEKLGSLFSKYVGDKPFLETIEAKKLLESINEDLMRAFNGKGSSQELFSKKISSWLKNAQEKKDYLMVRSTGAEDSRQTANAGGNLSVAYVEPTEDAVTKAIGVVVASYFSFSSLQNRLNAGLNPFKDDLKLAVTAQRLIGEPIGGAKKSDEIPISLVLFTNELLYIGNESFRVMRLSATYGHGEGVVGNQGIASDTALILQSLRKPDQLYILYDNQLKPERLAPVRTKDGIVLEKIENPSSIQSRPAITPEMLARLYHWGIIGEKFFEDRGTDMEIVIKQGTIYPVQARPVNRPDLLPTYLDTKKVSQLPKSPILEKLQGEIIVPGKASVVMIEDKAQILFADTLEMAEHAYNKKLHQLVVVRKQEPANSHPVVNFSGLGVPCLFMPKGEQVKALIERIDKDHPVLACVQTATLNLWNDKNIEKFISKGFAVHPAKIAVSLPLMDDSLAVKGKKEVPQEITDFLIAIRSAVTSQAALSAFKGLKEQPLIKELTSQRLTLLSKHVGLRFHIPEVEERLKAMETIDSQLKVTLEETGEVLKNLDKGQSLAPLFHAKALETVLIGTSSTPGVSQYSVLDVAPLAAEVETLIAYQQKLDHPAHFAKLLIAGIQEAPDISVSQGWQQFLLQLEESIQDLSKDEIDHFKTIIKVLTEANSLPSWLSLSFYPVTQWLGTLPITIVKDLLKEVTPESLKFLSHLLKTQKDLLAKQRQIGQFDDPKTFTKAYEELLVKVKELSVNGPEAALKGQLSTAPQAIRMTALQTMLELVTLYDLAIKEVKKSSKFDNAEKVKIFKKMLFPYLDLLKGWSKHLTEEPSLRLHSAWTLDGYLDKISEILTKLPEDVSQLTTRREFSVAAASMGSGALFERHLPDRLEEIFTLIHQNLLVCLGNLNQASVKAADIPGSPLFKKINTDILKGFGVYPANLLNIRITKEGVEVYYNIPLSNHSSQLIIRYDREGKITLKSQLLGEARERWGHIANLIRMLDEANVLSLDEPLRMGEQELGFIWKIPNEEASQAALEEFNAYIQAATATGTGIVLRNLDTRMASRQGDSAWQAILMRQAECFNQEPYSRILNSLQESDFPKYPFISLMKLVFWSLPSPKRDKLWEYIFSDPKNIALLVTVSSLPKTLRDHTYNELYLVLKNTFTSSILTVQSQAFQLLDEGHGEATKALVEAVISFQRMIIAQSVDSNYKLFTMLINKGHGYAAALSAVQVAMKGGTDWVDSVDQRQAMDLLEKIVDAGYDLKACEAVTYEILKKNDFRYYYKALDLIDELIDKDFALDGAEIAYEEGVKSDKYFLRMKSLELFGKLIEKKGSEYVDLSISAAQLSLKNSLYPNELIAAINLLKKLIDRGDAIKAAEAVVSDSLKPGNYWIALQLLDKLIDKGLDYALAVSVAQEVLENGEQKEQIEAIRLFQKLLDLDHVNAVEVAVSNALKTQKYWVALQLLDKLVDKALDYPLAISGAQAALKSSSLSEQNDAIILFKKILDDDHGIEAAEEAVSEALKSRRYTVALELLDKLVDKGQSYAMAVSAAQQVFKNFGNREEINAAIKLFRKLIDIDQGIQAAEVIVGEYLKSRRDRRIAFELADKLIEKGIALGASDIAFKEGVKNDDADLMDRALKLFIKLVDTGHAFESAAAAAKIGLLIDSGNYYELEMRGTALDLFEKLFKKGHGFEEAVSISLDALIKKRMGSEALWLLNKLFDSGRGFTETEASVKELMSHMAENDSYTNSYGIDILELLVKHRHAYETARIVASSIQTSDPEVREKANNLIKSLPA